jgi:hypothetical protein
MYDNNMHGERIKIEISYVLRWRGHIPPEYSVVQISVFWDVMLCQWVKSFRCLKGTNGNIILSNFGNPTT